MKYIKVFTDFAKAMEPLGDAECGRLFKAMLKYAETGDTPEFCGNERFIWPTAKSNIDRDKESYTRICERNRNNRNNQSSPVVTSGHQSSRHVQDKDKDKEKDKEDIERNINISLAQKSDDFDRFWSAYPRKKAKADAQKAWKGVKVELPIILNAIEQQKRSPDWQKEGGKYIPYPASWLRGKRWEDTDSQESDGPVIHEAPPEWDYDPNKGFLERLGVEF